MARHTLKRKAVGDEEIAPRKSLRLLKKSGAYTEPLRPLQQEVVGDFDPVLATARPGLAAGTAAHRALGVTELLENILIYLPITQIFTLQRVCRQFQEVFGTSITIKDKLFLRVSQKNTKIWKCSPNGSCVRTKDAPDAEEMEELQARTKDCLVVTHCNPFFTSNYGIFSGLRLRPEKRLETIMQQSVLGRPVPAALLNMHFSDCPVPRIQVLLNCNMDGKSVSYFVQAKDRDGCTVGKAFEAVRRTFQRSGNASVKIQGMEITLYSTIIPTVEQHQTCLPLPATEIAVTET